MLTSSSLFDYQRKAVNFQCTRPASALWLDMGLGKTAITLTSIAHLLASKYLRGVLIVAPIRVCRLVWRQEALKWDHTTNLRFSPILGTRDQRTRALMRPADIWLINYENLGWLAETLATYYISKNREIPFDGLVWDEISKCFVAGTPITTENSVIAIDKLKTGDMVMTHLGLRRVIDVMTSRAEYLVSVALSNGQVVQCTDDHPFLLNGEWVGAGSLEKGDLLYGASHPSVRSGDMRDMRGRSLETERGADHLLEDLFSGIEDARSLGQGENHQRGNQGSPETPGHPRYMEQGCTVARRHQGEDERSPQEKGSPASDRRERHWGIVGREFAENCPTGSVCSGVHFQDAVSATGLPYALQDRLRGSGEQDRNRGAGVLSHHDIGETKGLEEARILGKIRVESVVRHERSGGVDVWNITVEEAETYFAGGVLVHNCKNSATDRVKAIRKVMSHFKWITGLTGTPASNGYKDLHGQYLVLDHGTRLGTSKTAFRTRYYRKISEYKEVPYDDAEATIKQLIGDITLEMSAEDYNPLPDLIVNDVNVELPPETRKLYDVMEKEFFVQLDSGTQIEMFNQASLTNKCLQFANGAIYPVAGMPLWEPIHDAKLDALEDIIEECNGQPVLCSYAYRSDAERIMKRFAHLDPINLTECKSEMALNNAMYRWTTGACALMIGHPASMGHGIDGLQKTGHTLVWFGLNWSLDLYEQFNARIRRQGQGVPVICHRILALDTLDQAQSLALDEKATTQASLRNAIKEYRENKSRNP